MSVQVRVRDCGQKQAHGHIWGRTWVHGRGCGQRQGCGYARAPLEHGQE